MSPDELLNQSKKILEDVYSAMNWDRRLSSPDHTRHQFVIKPQLDKAVEDFRSCGFKAEHLEKILAGVLLERHYAKNVLALSNKLSFEFDRQYLYYLPYNEIVKSPNLTKLDFTKGVELVKSSAELQLDAFRVFVSQLTVPQLIVMFEKMYLVYDKPKRYAIVYKEIYDRHGIKQNDSSERDEELFKELAPEIREFLENLNKKQDKVAAELTIGSGRKRGRKSKSSTPLVISGMDELRKALEGLTAKEATKKETKPDIRLPKFTEAELEGYFNSVKVDKRKEEILGMPLIPEKLSEKEAEETINLITLFEATLELPTVKEDFKRLLNMRLYKQAVLFASIAFWYIDFSLDGGQKKRHLFIKEITDMLNTAIQTEIVKYNSIFEFKDFITPQNKKFLDQTIFKV